MEEKFVKLLNDLTRYKDVLNITCDEAYEAIRCKNIQSKKMVGNATITIEKGEIFVEDVPLGEIYDFISECVDNSLANVMVKEEKFNKILSAINSADEIIKFAKEEAEKSEDLFIFDTKDKYTESLNYAYFLSKNDPEYDKLVDKKMVKFRTKEIADFFDKYYISYSSSYDISKNYKLLEEEFQDLLKKHKRPEEITLEKWLDYKKELSCDYSSYLTNKFVGSITKFLKLISPWVIKILLCIVIFIIGLVATVIVVIVGLKVIMVFLHFMAIIADDVNEFLL